MLAGSFKNDNFKKRSFLKTILSFLIFRRRFLKNENVNIPTSALPPRDVYRGSAGGHSRLTIPYSRDVNVLIFLDFSFRYDSGHQKY